jgi:hypothetical protein
MHKYLIRIVMPDGWASEHYGLYPDGCAAVIRALELYPGAKRISARWLP